MNCTKKGEPATNLKQIKNLYVENIDESINSNFESLKKEIYNPVELNTCINNCYSKTILNDDEIKNYLFSILSPKKLQNIKEWLSVKEKTFNNNYKADVILHFYNFSLNNENLYNNQLLKMKYDTKSCNLNLYTLLELIYKNIKIKNSELGDKKNQITVLIGLLEVLKLEIFSSNSASIYEHKPSYLDNDVKDYLYTQLSLEKIDILKYYLKNKKKFNKKTNLGIITSIFVPDF